MLNPFPPATAGLLVLVLVFCLLLRRLRIGPRAARVEEALASPWTTLAVAACTALFYWWVWGGTLSATPRVHDEAAYLLQARLFSGGHWTAPGPVLPDFFEQFHVLITPLIASKYPPGHSLLLTPGVLVGLPGSIPLLLNGLAGALVYMLGRRLANAGVGLLTWALWLGCLGNLLWRPTYYSEISTSALGLAAWWTLLRWREGGRGWLILSATCIGWGAVTRPLTMLAFAIPIGAAVLHDVVNRKRWRDLAAGVGAGVAVLSIIPLWSAQTTGSWRTTPLSVYRETYIPWDRLGFGLDSTPARRHLPPDMEPVVQDFLPVHAQYTAARAPALLIQRAGSAARSAWSGWRGPLVLVALVGLFLLPPAGVVGLATSVLLLLAYGAYAHKPGWTLYYLEILPMAGFLTALGISGLVRLLLRGNRESSSRLEPAWRCTLLAALMTPFLLGLTVQEGSQARRWLREQGEGHRTVETLLAGIPVGKAIVFVTYAPDRDIHDSYVTNEPVLDRARIWMVHDLGPRNDELIASAPDRVPYRFDEASGRMIRLRP